MAVAAVSLLLLADAHLRPAALAIVTATLAPLAGAAAQGLVVPLLVGVAVALAALATSAESALALGALAAGLAIAGSGASALAERASLAALGPLAVAAVSAVLAVAPFALAAPGARDDSLRLAARSFAWSPLAAAASAAGVDLLRNDRLYAISTLGSSFPLGYPSPWLHGVVAAAVGSSMLAAARRLRSGSPS